MNDDCVCRFGPGGSCTTDLANGVVDFGDCDGEFACYGGACLNIVGSVCSENAACGSSHCECVDAACDNRICAATQCMCGYGAGGSCDQYLPNGASDPEDCDQAGHVCWDGVCRLEQGESCDTSDQCVSDSCLNGVCLPHVCDDAAIAATPYSGSGTANDPFLLCTPQQLQSIQAAHLGSVFHVGSDIDLSGHDGQGSNPAFVPIGPSFTGVFDGRGYDIVNLTSQAGGLLHELSDSGTIRNLNLIDATVTGTGEELGMLVDTMSSASARVELCRVNGHLSGDGSYYVGGLVGWSDGILQGCHVGGAVDASNASAAGGLVGRASSYAVIHACSTDVSLLSDDVVWTGGLVGFNHGEILGCHAVGDVYAAEGDLYGIGAGGLVGTNEGWGKILRSYATGDVETDGSGGGLVGAMSDAPVAADTYATGQVKCVRACGGLVGSSSRDIYRSYATGHVFGQTSDLAGGLVGEESFGQISDSFAVGLVEQTPGNDGYGVGNGHAGAGTMLNCFWYDANPADSAWTCNDEGSPAGVCEQVSALSALFDPSHAVYTRTDAAWDFTNDWISHADSLPTLRP